MFQVTRSLCLVPSRHSPPYQPLRVLRAFVQTQLGHRGASGRLTAKDVQPDASQYHQRLLPTPRCRSPPAASPVENRTKRCPQRSVLHVIDN
ncbi:hypothetical protein NDU88_006408 [Pleurodeles waltl]|uniref:Uncharacterized protein n=1 Tax=Pleurodeles waltl TaxID=8319 RepID=A0AAV7N2Y1_PLEWA|nr:hypothetical protein NDU88_006408 [Pleurodeles waltl]